MTSELPATQQSPAPAPPYWTTAKRLQWFSVALLLCTIFGPRFLHCMRPLDYVLLDFYQEWSSAKNVFNELPVYAPVAVSIDRYLGMESVAGRNDWDVNVHPPTSVLLAIPLHRLNYSDAYLVWNCASLLALVVSLWLVIRELHIRFTWWSLLPLCSLLVFFEPFYQQMRHGQLNLILLVLIVGVWVADRRGAATLAGALLAAAAAIKLFPAFLVCYFVLQRKWKTVWASAVAFLLITGFTAWVLGTDTYRTYVTEILPTAGTWKSAWNNASVAGFWHKLFDPGSHGGSTEPLILSPPLALAGTLLCWGLVMALLAPVVWRAADRRQRDIAFGLTTIAMLLISPVTWEHYFLLLMVPLAVVWLELPATRLARWSLLLVFLAMSQPIILICNWVIPGGFDTGVATPLHTVSLLSFQFYALVGLYAMGLYMAAAHSRTASAAACLPARNFDDVATDARQAVPARLLADAD